MWRTIGLSVGMPSKLVCQDAHRWHLLDENTLLFTVADGAGTAPRAEIGADIASRAALDYLVHQTTVAGVPKWEQDSCALVQGAMWTALDALRVEATRQSTSLDNYATTLIVAISTPEFIVVAQVGDGIVFVSDANGKIVRLTVPQRGEYSNETCMLTSLSAPEKVQIVFWNQPITGLAAMTDGLLPITTTLPLYEPYSPFFTNMFSFLRKTADMQEAQAKLRGFLLSDKVQNGTGDDLTLILAVSI